MAEIIPIEQLEFRIQFLRSKNKDLAIIATNGCFDILHVGHVRSLQKAKTYGDILIVGLNSDNSVKSLKGNERPINNENDRAEVLASLSCIDFISIFNEQTAERFLELIKPNIYVKGSEYDIENLPEGILVKKQGGKIIRIPMIPGSSTTSIISKIKQLS